MSLITMERISLKNHPEINESAIQKFIFDDPSVLGLPGEVSAIQREKLQPSGGRLDMLFGDDGGTRYEVEIQLGATDPSHIIRTIEYWDTEKKRYPQYDHCAVIVAEEITGRFMNVISLFNGAIPLIALQMSAYKMGDDISLTFTKVIDRIELGSDEEEEFEVTDRHYWEARSTTKMLKLVDAIFEDLGELVDGYEMKYNKFYIGLAKDGVAKNYLYFKPKKQYAYLFVKGHEDQEIDSLLDDAGIDYTYVNRGKNYRLKIKTFDEYKQNRELILKLVDGARSYYDL